MSDNIDYNNENEQAAQLTEENTPTASEQTIEIKPMAADDDTEPVREYFDAPFGYNHGDNENVALNSGAFSYTSVDLILPGKNGLDLVIKRRYDSSQASDEDFVINSTRAVVRDRTFISNPDLGYGWSLGLPAIEHNPSGKTAKYLHMGDGRVFKLKNQLPNKAAESNLVGYKRLDLRLAEEKGTLSIHSKSVSYKYILYYKDGKKDYFNGQDIVATVDRYGNAISYDILSNGVTITDTFKRTLKLGAVSGGYRWTGLPDGKYISYAVSGGKFKSCTNQEGKITRYEYQEKKIECSPYEKEADAYVTYTVLSAVNHPTGVRTEYTYSAKVMYINAKAYLLDWLTFSGRKDIESGVTKNSESYYYSAKYLSPGDYIAEAGVTKTINSTNKLITTHKFSNKALRSSEEIVNNSTVVSKKTIVYDDYDLPKTETYTSPFSQTISYIYDKNGNLTSATDTLGNKVDMKYHATYNYLIRKEYKKDKDTTIVEEYTPHSNGLNPEWLCVYVNGTLRNQTQYYYVSNQLRQERCYYGTLSSKSRYLYTAFSYASPYTPKPTLIQSGRVSHSDSPYIAAHSDTSIEYDWYGNEIKKTDTNKNETTFTYDALGRLTKELYADGTSKQNSYDDTNNRIISTDENGNSKRLDYTPLGKISKVYDLKTDTLLKEYQYDSLCRLKKEISYCTDDRLVIDYTYDYFDRPTLKRQSDQNDTVLYEESITYSNASITETKTVKGDGDAPDIVTIVKKDKLGRVTRQNYGLDSYETFTYDTLGNKLSATNALNAVTKWEYDFAGRVVKETNALNKSASTVYDALGNKTSSTDFKGNTTTYKYDAAGRLIEQLSPFDGSYKSKIQYTYDATGNVTKQLVACNNPDQAETFRQTENEYDKRNRLTKSTLYDGAIAASVTEYIYDSMGNKTQIKTGSFVTKYEYNQFGNMTKQTDALNKSDIIQYDDYGILQSKTDRNGNVISYTYDALGRMLTESSKNPKGMPDASVTYSYTKTGQKKSESNANLTVGYTYDALGRLKTLTESNGIEKAYGYDTAGNRTSFVLKRNGADEINSGYVYDLMNRMTSVKENGAEIASYTYDDNGNRLTLTNSNGTSAAYTYNQANLVTSLTNKKGSATLSGYTYEYQLDGNQTKKTDNKGKSTTYLYDGLGRLTEENESGGNKLVYTYDVQGNRKTMTVSGEESYAVTYTCDANNRLLEEFTQRGEIREYRRFSYDLNGNQLTKAFERFAPKGTETATAGFKKKTDVEMFESRMYNGFNRLISVFADNVNTTYTYRPDGLRHSKETFDYNNTQSTVHLWDGQNICAEQNASGVFARYLRGVNLIARKQDNLNQYYHFNAHGDVVQRTDYNGVVLKSYDYDAFGVEKNLEPMDANPWRYCGEYYSSETKDYYLRARSYMPTTGRFTQEDPIGDGLNWYTYCGNSPILFMDATGCKPYTYSVGKPWDKYTLYSTMVSPGWYDGMKTGAGFVPFANPVHDGVMWYLEGWVAMDSNFAKNIASVTTDTLSTFTEWGKAAGFAGTAINAIDVVEYKDYMLSAEYAVDQAMFSHIKPKNNDYFLSASRKGAEDKFNNAKDFFRDLVLKGELEVRLGSEITKEKHYLGSCYVDPLTGATVSNIYDDRYYFIAPEDMRGYYYDWINYDMNKLGKGK